MTSLSDKVARVKELQANCYPDGVKDAQALGYAIFMFKQEADNMAALIAQLWEEREQNRTVMEQALEALQEADEQVRPQLSKQEGFFTRWLRNPVKDKTQIAITSLKQALGR